MEQVISNTKVSVSDFRKMLFDDNDDFFYEIIEGEMIQKSAPAPIHQRVSRKLTGILDRFISDKSLGEIFYAPIDVDLDEYNKPQPDLVFVSEGRRAIITDDGIMGVPDLIVEVISPSSVIRDRIEKKNTYERLGVKEFWIVDPQYKAIEIYTIQKDRYELLSGVTMLEGELKSAMFEGLSLNLDDIFSAV